METVLYNKNRQAQFMKKTEIFDILIQNDYILKLIDDRKMFEATAIFDEQDKKTYHWIKENEFDIVIPNESFNTNEPFFKIVFTDSHTYMFVALPIIHENKKMIIELIKDITNHGSLYIDDFKDGTFHDMISEIQTEILRDSLTGAFKYHHGIKKLEESIASTEDPLTLIYFSINHLLEINDKFSQKAGDMMITQTARLLQNYLVSDQDFITRLNGPRFFMVLHNTNKQRAYSIAKAINRKASQNTYYYNNEALKLSLNIGYSNLKDNNIETEALIEEAKENVLINNTTTLDSLLFSSSKNSDALKILSNREHEIARFLLNGLSNSEISDQCFISESTVKKHISSIYAKLNTKSRAEFLSRFNNKAT